MGKSVASLVDLETRIFTIRGLSVLFDSDLALLYGVSTKALLQAVRRNPECFPSDFMFQLSNQEVGVLRSQFVTSKRAEGRGGRRNAPYAFTDQGDIVESIRRQAALPPRERSRPIGFTADLDSDSS